eukprot:COSAG02_NODE_6235_length_3707_cov_2.136364_4_plen_57_part_00
MYAGTRYARARRAAARPLTEPITIDHAVCARAVPVNSLAQDGGVASCSQRPDVLLL